MAARKHRTNDELKASMCQSANKQRDVADEMAAMWGGCDDPLHPWGPQVFRDYMDFIDRVCRPLIEADGDEKDGIIQKAMALYRKETPYGICVSMVMMQNRIKELEESVIPPMTVTNFNDGGDY